MKLNQLQIDELLHKTNGEMGPLGVSRKDAIELAYQQLNGGLDDLVYYLNDHGSDHEIELITEALVLPIRVLKEMRGGK
jgi:hypothetical protein